MEAPQKTIVISGVNMTNSGLLSVLSDCLWFLSEYARGKNIRIIALVHAQGQFEVPGVEFIAFPKSKKSWFYRLYYEYIHFHTLSKKWQPDIWLSLHDISARVVAKKKFVYCHNPSPFFKPTLTDWKYGFKIGLFTLFYKHLYRINIKSNTAVIVQQHWIKEAFEQLYGIKNVIVAYPEIYVEPSDATILLDHTKHHFFYPGFPRMFKNFELIGDAVALLPETIRSKIQIHLTLEKTDNSYAAHIVDTYGKFPEVHFTGVIPRELVTRYYNACDVLLFPSRLETWGLPLTEFQHYGKPVFAINLPYARETIGYYHNAYFFEPGKPQELAQLITQAVTGTLPEPRVASAVKAPDFKTWDSLFDFLFEGI